MDFFWPDYVGLDNKRDTLPYMTILQRETLKTIDPSEFRRQLENKYREFQQPQYIVVHAPFEQYEHDLVIEYIQVMQAIPTEILTNYFPIQLLKKINRSWQAVQNYILDLIQRGTSDPDPDTIEFRIYKHEIRTLFKESFEYTPGQFTSIQQISDYNFIIRFPDPSTSPKCLNIKHIGRADHKDNDRWFYIPKFLVNDPANQFVTYGSWAVLLTPNEIRWFDLNSEARTKKENIHTYVSGKLYYEHMLPINEVLSSTLIPSPATKNTFLIKTNTKVALYSNPLADVYMSKQKIYNEGKDDIILYAGFAKNGDVVIVDSSNKIYLYDPENQRKEKSVVVDSSFTFLTCQGETLIFCDGNQFKFYRLVYDNDRCTVDIVNKYNVDIVLPHNGVHSCSLINDSFVFMDNEYHFFAMDLEKMHSPTNEIIYTENRLSGFIKIVPFEYYIKQGHDKSAKTMSKTFFAACFSSEILLFRPNGASYYQKIKARGYKDVIIDSTIGRMLIVYKDKIVIYKMCDGVFYETEAENQI